MLGYAAPSTFALTLVNLAADSARESICIDNTTTKYDDFMLTLQLGIATPTAADQWAMYVYFAANVDGTNFTGTATGTDAAITIGTSPFFGPFAFPIQAGTVWYDCTIPSVATFFGGLIPPRWSVIVENQANGAFMGTEPTKYVRGIFYTT